MKTPFEDAPSSPRAFNPAAWRFLLADRSKFLFIESDSAQVTLSDELVDRVATVGRVLDESAIILIDGAQRIDAVVRADAFPSQSLHLNLGVGVRALALTPELVRELPAWHLTPSTYRGFSGVQFEKPLTTGPTTTIQRILEFLAGIRSAPPVATIPIRVESAGYALSPSLNVRTPTADRRDSDSRDPHPDVEALLGIRKQLREQIPMLDASSWAQLRGTAGSNPTAALTKYKNQGRLFSVSEGRRELYPQFQFDPNAAPLQAIAEILKDVPPDARGWPLLSWFNARNVLLDGRKPLEVLGQDPEAVKRAAADYYLQDD